VDHVALPIALIIGLMTPHPSPAAEVIPLGLVTPDLILVQVQNGHAVWPTLGNGEDGKIVGEMLVPADHLNPSAWKVKAGKAIYKVTSVSHKARGTEWTKIDWKKPHTKGYFYFLKLDKPLDGKKPQRITIEGPWGKAGYEFDWCRTVSEAVHVNLVGFGPGHKKYAYWGAWSGTGGPVSFGAPTEFQILDESSRNPVFTGKMRLRKSPQDTDEHERKLNLTFEEVWEMDFSPLTKEGTYVVAVAGIGCSRPFRIGRDMYRDSVRTILRAFYHQRCGIERKAEHTEYVRPRCHHPDDMVILKSTVTLAECSEGPKGGPKAKDSMKALVETATNEKCRAWGGWHDAGDWDRRAQHLPVSDRMFDLYEWAPEFWKSLEAGIPESGDAIPDIVDEALFNLSFYRRMQEPDGGVGGGIEEDNFPRPGQTSYTDTMRNFAYAPDPWASYLFAAVAAHASSVLRGLGKADDAKGWAADAGRAFAWADRHGGQKDWRDDRAFAAVRLLEATGDVQYVDALRKSLAWANNPGSELENYPDMNQEPAARALVTGLDRMTLPVRQSVSGWADSARAALLRNVEYSFLPMYRARAFRNTGHRWVGLSWGNTAVPELQQVMLGWRLEKRDEMRDAVTGAADFMFGGNPLNLSWVTGVGSNPVRAVLHIESWYDGIDEPVPGIAIFGPCEGMDGNWHMDWIHKSLEPDWKSWPIMEIWAEDPDCAPGNEFTPQSPMIQSLEMSFFCWLTAGGR
jgi:endoglucanase